MSMIRASGDMFEFVTHTANPMGGECNHNCRYCFVKALKKRYKAMREKYSGEPRIHITPSGKSALVNYYNDMNWHNGIGKNCPDCGTTMGKGHLIDGVTHEKIEPVVVCRCGYKPWTYNTIFMVDCGDMFASNVPDEVIREILAHCNKYPKNTYLFLTKNPDRYRWFKDLFPPNTILGVTIETDLYRITDDVSDAPRPICRLLSISEMKTAGFRIMISVEPIMLFTETLSRWITGLSPEFIAVGADSGGNDLKEPSADIIEELIRQVEKKGIHVFRKPNLRNIDESLVRT